MRRRVFRSLSHQHTTQHGVNQDLKAFNLVSLSSVFEFAKRVEREKGPTPLRRFDFEMFFARNAPFLCEFCVD
jgi:hypothetical protein